MKPPLKSSRTDISSIPYCKAKKVPGTKFQVTNSGDKTQVWNEHEKISGEWRSCVQSTCGVWRSQRRSIMWMRFLSKWQYCCRLNTPKVLNQIFIRWYIQMTNRGVMFVMCIIESSGHVQVTKTISGGNPGAGYNSGEKTRRRVCEDQQKIKKHRVHESFILSCPGDKETISCVI